MNETGPLEKVSMWLATGLGLGLVSPAPGTIGGLWGLPLAWGMSDLAAGQQRLVLVGLVLVSVVICNFATQALGGGKDPQSIVLDEIVALPVVYLGIGEKNLAIWIVGFLLFRLFDITKPFPVRYAEKLPGGIGIMADDIVAAVYAMFSLHVLLWLDSALAWEFFNPTL